jgi:hypothetical protein
MDRVTLSSLVGSIVVIGLDGNIRTLAAGESPKPGELIIEEISDTSELIVEQVTPQGSSINVTDDISALIEAIAQGQDPTQLGEEFETAAGGDNGSSPQNTGVINRTGAEVLANTNFETIGINGIGFSSTQVRTLLDIFQPQEPDPQVIPDPATVVVQEISSPTVNEGEQVFFEVTLDQATEAITDIEFSLNDGSAVGGTAGEDGVDYVNTTVLVTLPDGATQQIQVNEDGTFTLSLPIGVQSFTVSLDTIDDDIYEGPETFILSGATADQASPVSGTATVLDDGSGPGPDPDDDRPSVSISDAGTIDEGNTATFSVTLSNASEDAVQVQLALNPEETEVGDLGILEYNTGSGWMEVPVGGLVTVPAGMTEFDVRIATIGDEVYEGPEDFSVTVTGVGVVQGSDTGLATIVDDGTITDDDRPSVSISDAGLVDEGNTATFTVTLSNASEDAVQVQLALNPEETEAGDLGILEYNTGSGWMEVPVGGLVTVPAGMTEFDVRIATIGDEVYEGPEDFSVTVTGVGVVQGSDTGLATIVDDGTITDDDRPSVSISDAGLVDEGNTATFTVTLSNASEDAVQVQLALNPEETEAGDLGILEYNTGSGWMEVPVGGLVTVPAGMTEFDVRIATIGDEVYEGPEDFSVTVTGVGVVQGSDTGLGTIVDDGTITDDDRPSVSISDAGLVDEGNTATFTVTLSNASEDAVQVQLALNPEETEAGDLGILEYNTGAGWVAVPVSGIVTVPAMLTQFDVRIATIDDEVYEGPEDFSVTVTGVGVVQGSDTGLATIVDDGTITDDDRSSVSISDAGLVDEGNTATFTVTLSNASEDAVQVQLALNPEETEAGDLGILEYNTGSGWMEVPVGGLVTVPAGMTEFDVRIATIGDEVYEGPEDFSVTVTGVGVVQGSDTGLATIVDDGTITDDDRPSVSISDAGLVDEGNTATFTVTLSNASEDAVQVQLALNPDETEVGDLGTLEYNTGSGWVAVPVSGIVTVPAMLTQFDVRIATNPDDVYEGPEDFSVTVTGLGAVQGSDTGLATIVDDGTITDDDRPTVSISDAGLVDEGNTATFTVTLSNASEAAVQVQLALNPDETEVGDLGALEYNTGSGWVAVPVSGIVTVPAMLTQFDVRIATNPDDVYEGPEDFSVTVTGLGAVQGSDTGLATIVDDGTITDDDRPTVSISDAGLVDEGNTATFTVTLSNASEDAVQVQLALNPDETEVGDLGTLEYNTGSGWVAVPVSGIVTVPAMLTQFDVRIATIDDEVYEGPEDFSVTVTGLGAVQGSDTGLATIVDDGTITDDDRPTVSISDAGLVDEGNTATFTVTLSNASEDAVQVQLALNPDETEVGDLGTLEYNTGSGWVAVPVSGIVTVPAMLTQFDVRIATIDDEVYEGPEDFSVTVTGLGAVQGSDTGLATIVDDGTITDDDRPTVSISDAGLVDEGNTATFTVTLSNASEDAVQVQLALNPDETEVGDLGTLEYNTGSGWVAVPVSGVVTVPAMLTQFDVRIATIDDEVYEGPEDFSVTVTGLGAVQGSDTGLATIVDDGTITDDDRPTVSISDAGLVDEGNTATFTVTLSNASEAAVQVQLALNPDETEVGDLGALEYNTGSGWVAVPVSGIVTVPAMLTQFDVRIATIDDEVYEGPEDFSVTVTGVGVVQGSDTGLATIVDDGTITDDDRPTVSISDAGTIDEGNFATFTVSLSNASEAAVQVQLTLNLDETEVGDLGALEYNTGSGWVAVPVSGIVTVPAGMTEFDLRIESIDDGVYEGPEDFSVTVTGLGPVQGSDTGLATIVDNSPPTARDFIISLNVQDGIFPVQDVEFDGLTSAGEQRVEDLEDDTHQYNGTDGPENDADIEIVITSLPEHGELYYVDSNGNEVIIDQDFLNNPNNKLYEDTDIKYRLTEDFFEEQSFDSADLLEDQGKDILVGSYTPPNSNLTFTGGQIITIGNSIIFDSDAQISVDFANQQVGLVVVSPGETGQGDEISTSEYVTLELDDDLSANEAKLSLASLNDRFNSGAAWLTAYIFLNGALVDVQQFYSTDITYTGNHEGFITVAMANGSFDEIRLTPDTSSSSDKAGFTLVGTEITSFTDVNDDFTYQAIDTDGAVSNEATVSVNFDNVTSESVSTANYDSQTLTLTAVADAEANIIMGDDGDNELIGTSGDDILIGGLGNDILTGGEGDDVFKWTEMKTATDTVTDFEAGDKLDFTDLFEDVSQSDITVLLDNFGSGDFSGQVDDISISVTERGHNSTLMIHKGGMDLEVNFDGASATDIANSLISNLEQLRE